MAIPRSTNPSTFAPGAGRRPLNADTFTSIAAGATTVFTFALPRQFKPQKPVSVVFPSGLQAGLNVGAVYITGNAPSDGGANYVLNVPITNSTAGALTPTSQSLTFVQD